MPTRTLKLQIVSELKGSNALASIEKQLKGSQVALVKFSTATKISDGNIKVHTHSVQLASSSQQALNVELNKTKRLLKDTTSSRITAKRDTRLETSKARSDELLRATERGVKLQKLVISQGLNSINVLRERNAQKAIQLRKNLAVTLARIDQSFATGTHGNRINAQRSAALKRFRDQTLKLHAETTRANRRHVEEQKAITAAKKQTTKAQAATLHGTRSVIRAHRSWTLQIAEGIGLYRAVSFAITGISAAIRAIPRVGIEFQTTQAVLESTLGSNAAASTAFKVLAVEAERAGKNILTLRENFRNLNASMSLAGETTGTVFNVFRNLNTISTALHLSTAKTQGLFLAISQIFNKTKVQSEELVKQLGNLLPGAFAAFARSMEISTRELTKQLEAGLVDSSKVDKFVSDVAISFSAAFVIAEQGIQATTERMQTSFIELGEAIFLGLEKPMKQTLKGLTVFATVLKSGVSGLGDFVEILNNSLVPALGFAATLLVAWAAKATLAALATIKLRAATLIASASLNTLKASVAFLINPITIIAGIVAIATALDRIKNRGLAAAKSASDFFVEIDKKAAERKEDPIAFKFEAQVDADETVRSINNALDDVAFRLARTTKRITDLRALPINKGNRTRSGQLSDGGQSADLKKAIKEQKNLFIIQGAGFEQLARERIRVGVELDAQLEKEKELQRVRQESLADIAKEGALRARQKEDARIKKELAYQNVLASTEVIILKAQGKEREAALKSLAIKQRSILQQLTGTDKITASIREQLILAEELQRIELGNTFDKKAQEQVLIDLKDKQAVAASSLAAQEAFINAEKDASVITEIEAFDKVQEKRIEALATMREILQTQIDIAGTNPSKSQVAGFKQAEKAAELFKLKMIEAAQRPKTEIQKLGKEVQTSLESSLGNAFAGFIRGTKSASEAMAKFASSILDEVARIAAQKLAVQLIGLAINTIAGGSGNSTGGGGIVEGGGGFNSQTSTAFDGVLANAKGNAFSSKGNVVPFASGGVINSPIIFPFAQGVGLAGEAGAEAILPLKRDKSGNLGVISSTGKNGESSSGNVIIQQLNVYVEQSEEDETSEEQATKIGKAIKDQLKTMVQSEIEISTRSGNQLNPTQLQAEF